jgi:uncharacterized protein YutE (UPF0331/DUF86 family)
MRFEEKIARKLKFMQEYVSFLRRYKDISKQELEKNYELKSAIERNFQIAIEACLEIGEIIISKENLPRPEDYKSVILALGTHGMLPRHFAEEFSGVAGFRNILVHCYAEVDTKKLCEFLKKLGDFDKFASAIAKYLKR